MTWNAPETETEWTRRWERTFRRTHWIERDGKFFPMGTRPDQMSGTKEPLPAGWARVGQSRAVIRKRESELPEQAYERLG
jgi:hypothetical protein